MNVAIANIVGKPVTLFAFPYGDCNADLIEICRDEGFQHVFTVAPASFDPCSRSFVRGRVVVDLGPSLSSPLARDTVYRMLDVLDQSGLKAKLRNLYNSISRYQVRTTSAEAADFPPKVSQNDTQQAGRRSWNGSAGKHR